LAQYVERPAASTFMDQPPTGGGRIVSTRQLGGGVTEWMLSNGIRVLVKPSPNAPGTIAINGTGPKGYAAFVKPGESPVPAVLMGEAIAGGGFGKFRSAEVNHILVDHHVKAHFLIDEQSTLIGGEGRADAFETILQAIYLQATQPGIDESWITYLKNNMAYKASQKGHSIQDAFQDTMKLTMASYNPLARATVITPATAEMLDPAKSLADVKAIFADMSQWDFIIVGDVRLDTLAPLIARYLGALPGHPSGPHIDASKRVPIDLGIRAPSGVVQKTLQADLVPRTTTVFVFHGAAPFTRAGEYNMFALQEILKMRLLDKLQKQLGATSDVDVKGEFAHAPTPVPTYKVTISYSCDPNRAGELATAVFAIIDSLKAAPPSDAEMSTLRSLERNALEENAKSDAALMYDMQEYNAQGWSFDLLGKDLDVVNAWTGADVVAAARQYLNVTNYVQFNVVPKPIELGF
jgi:zinc protease